MRKGVRIFIFGIFLFVLRRNAISGSVKVGSCYERES